MRMMALPGHRSVGAGTSNSLHCEISGCEAPLRLIASYVLPTAVLNRAALEGDQAVTRRHLMLLIELEHLVATSCATFKRFLIDNLDRYPTPERDYDLSVALERAVRAAMYPARARLSVDLCSVPDSARSLADSVMNVAAPLESAAQAIGDVGLVRGYTKEARGAARLGEELYESGIAELFDRRFSGNEDSGLEVMRRLAVFGALRSALRACLAAAEQCERFTLMSM